MFGWLRRRGQNQAVGRLYELIVAQSRRPEFYRDLGVADTLDGRFDMLALHAMLVMRRLKGEPERSGQVGQDLFDHMFYDMDRSLREIGVGDLSVGKRVKQMGSAFLGRIAAYEDGLSSQDGALEDALLRNVYRDEAPEGDRLSRLARYMRAADAKLLATPLEPVLAGEKAFEDLIP